MSRPSVARGARQRDERVLVLLDPVAGKLERKENVSTDEIQTLANMNFVRPLLYQMLFHLERLDLFPANYLDDISQGEARLAYWMMHPNELQDPPAQTEFTAAVERNVLGKDAKFFVYRYKMPPGHWAGTNWLLGLAGPYIEGDPPYIGNAGAFSRCGDEFGKIAPEELVDWYIGIVLRKAGISPQKT